MPSGEFKGIAAGVMFRRLFALLLLAVALTAAPLGMPAMAAAMSPHAAMASPAHCDEQQQPAHHQATDKSCCAAMCVAVVAPSGPARLPAYHGPSGRPAPDRVRLGYLGDIATPPPRGA